MIIKSLIKKVFGLLLLFSGICNTQVYGQLDSAQYKLESMAAFSTQPYLTHYQYSLQHGKLNHESPGLYLNGQAEVPFDLGEHWHINTLVEGQFMNQRSYAQIQQAYAEVSWRIFSLYGGMKYNIDGEVPEELTSGSMGISGNARPIPGITTGIPEYWYMSFLNDYVGIKGELTHGWLDKDRYITNPLWHRKYISAIAGKKDVIQTYGSMYHYAHWGGTRFSNQKLPSSLRDFYRVLFGMEGKTNELEGLGGEVSNVYGNHFGFYDFGLKATLGNFKITQYNQKFFEDYSGMGNPFSRNKDWFSGIHIENKKKNPILQGVAYEFIKTNYQSGPGLPDDIGTNNYGYKYGGRDDYYNNYLYQYGFTYKKQTLGNPLFLTKFITNHYFENLKDYNSVITNNRIIGHHIGMRGNLKSNLSYLFKGTFSKNYGTYAGLNDGRDKWRSKDPKFNYEFDPPLKQWHFLLKINWNPILLSNITLKLSTSIDRGQLTNNEGINIGVVWEPTIKF